MRELIERFAGRYQIWRDEQRAERGDRNTNPLIPFACAAAALVAWDVYKIVSSHQLGWRSVEADVLFIVFLILCAWRPKWAWFMFLIWGATMVVESPWVYTLEPLRHPPRVRLMSALFFAAMGIAAFAYGFVLRKRYESYHSYRESEKRPYAASDKSI
jgi:hypothetical protein